MRLLILDIENGYSPLPCSSFSEAALNLINVCFQAILADMRFILLMASLVIVSLLVLKGYPGGGSKNLIDPVTKEKNSPIKKAHDVNQLIEDTANTQRQALEEQLQ